MRTKVSLVFTLAFLNLTRSIFTRKFHIEKISTRGKFAEIYRKYKISSVCFCSQRFVFLSTETRKAGVMVQPLTIHYLNTYFRLFITLSIKFYSFEHRSYSTAKRVV
jgi:hypothetical protein